MTATVTHIPIPAKHSRKVSGGQSADILSMGTSVAERFARLMALEHSPDLTEASIAEWRSAAANVTRGGMTHATIDERIKAKRIDLRRQLVELDRI